MASSLILYSSLNSQAILFGGEYHSRPAAVTPPETLRDYLERALAIRSIDFSLGDDLICKILDPTLYNKDGYSYSSKEIGLRLEWNSFHVGDRVENYDLVFEYEE